MSDTSTPIDYDMLLRYANGDQTAADVLFSTYEKQRLSPLFLKSTCPELPADFKHESWEYIGRRLDNEIDRHLVARFVKGDERGFNALFDRYNNALVKSVLRLNSQKMRGKEDLEAIALDLAQDTWVEIINGIQSLSEKVAAGQYTFGALFFTYAKNNCRDFAKKKSTGEVSLKYSEDGELLDDVGDDSENPERRRQQQDTFAAVNGALADLTEKEREAITSAGLFRLSYEEIATEQGVKVETIKERLKVARKKLRSNPSLRSFFEEETA